jgi:acyl-coenzyme A thioesterase PaaI-like protein
LILLKIGEEEMKFETYGNCFVCGENNPGGLHLIFEIDKEKQTLKTTFTASPIFQGWDGIVHGGIICTLLDEAMAKLVYELGFPAVTASLEIRFKKPAPILEPLHVYGTISEVSKRLIRAKAHVAREDGTVLATGISTFLRQNQ